MSIAAVEAKSSVIWFRKGLRVHDNPALVEACKSGCNRIYPIFIIDPWFAKPSVVGINRYAFLLESLRDLDLSLRKLGSRLYIIKGKPEEQLPIFFEKWEVSLLCFESDTEPYAVARDRQIFDMCGRTGVKVSSHISHTLFSPVQYISKNKGSFPVSYGSFQKLFISMGTPRLPLLAPSSSDVPQWVDMDSAYDVPTLVDMGMKNHIHTRINLNTLSLNSLQMLL